MSPAIPVPGEPQTLWAASDVLPDGSYGLTLTVGADRSWTLTRDQAIAYAVTCIQRATAAEHDAAAYRLLTRAADEPADEPSAALLVIQAIREARVEDHTATEPLRFRVQLGRRGPFIAMDLDGQPAGELTPADLRAHAVAVLDALAAADLDAALRRVLVDTIGLDDTTAGAAVGDLANHWPVTEVRTP